MSASFNSTLLTDWHARGQTLTVHGLPVFVVHEPGRRPAEDPLLLLHGYPTSSRDFSGVIDRLARSRPVVAFDFPGFGLSSKPEAYSYSLLEQAEIALGVWAALGLKRGHLLAHDYGTSVATEILARRARGGIGLDIRSLTLCNGSVHIELAKLTMTQRVLRHRQLGPWLAKLSSARFFETRIRATFADGSKLSSAEAEAMWEALVSSGGRARMPTVTQYLRERVRFWHRWIGALTEFDRPAHVVWGREDPIAVTAIADQLLAEIPGAEASWLDGVGHYPQIEAPDRWCDAIESFAPLQAVGSDEA